MKSTSPPPRDEALRLNFRISNKALALILSSAALGSGVMFQSCQAAHANPPLVIEGRR